VKIYQDVFRDIFFVFSSQKDILNNLVSPARRLEKILKYLINKVQSDEKENGTVTHEQS